MKLRLLRFAWSALFGLAALLVLVLWVRSHWWFHSWLRNGRTDSLYIQLFEGELKVSKIGHRFQTATNETWYPATFSAQFMAESRESGDFPPRGAAEDKAYIGPLAPANTLNVAFNPKRIAVIPLWFIMLATATLAAVPWFRWSTRYSLRTLLIALTAAAIALGCAIYAFRR